MKKLIKSQINSSEFRELFLAGRSRLTLRNQNTGTHLTIHAKQLINKNDKTKLPLYVLRVSLLGDRESGYVYAGILRTTDLLFKRGRGITWDSQIGKVVTFIINCIKNPMLLREKNVSLFHEGKCCRCGLPLTHPQSINRGLGDECFKHTQKETYELPF